MNSLDHFCVIDVRGFGLLFYFQSAEQRNSFVMSIQARCGQLFAIEELQTDETIENSQQYFSAPRDAVPVKSLVKSSTLPKIQFDGLGSAGSTLTFYNLSRRYAYFIVALAKRGCVYCKQVQVSGPDDVSVQIDKCLQGTRLYLVYDLDCVQLFDEPVSFSDASVESKLS